MVTPASPPGRTATTDADLSLTQEAGYSKKPWARILSFDSLRYHGSGWWLDAALPRHPIVLLVFAFAVPCAWVGVGALVTEDREGFFTTPDVMYQIPFFALHILSLRVMASLWSRGLAPALEGLGIPDDAQAKVRHGLLGPWSNLGALLACSYFIVRDTLMGYLPNEESGLTAFYDPDRWDFGSLGPGVHALMTGLWHAEWLIFGYLLWVQLWLLYSLSRTFLETDFTPHLSRILVSDGYRDFFTLLAKAATVSMIFAFGNLGFIHVTGELIPRERVPIDGVGDFLREMSDLLSTTLLFAAIIAGVVAYVHLLRRGLTQAVNRLFAKAGDVALREMADPLVATGNTEADLAELRARVEAHSGLVRAISFQREVDAIGGRALTLVVLKGVVPLFTALMRMLKMGGGG